MPVSIKKLPGRQRYRVSTPGGTKAKSTTKAKAERQQRLLNAIDHGWKPTGKHESMSTPQHIVKVLLGEDEHSDLYDQLLAIGEKLGPDSDVYHYIDLIADVYNGGIQQCIEHDRDFDEFASAARFLRANGGPQAHALATAFQSLRRSYTEAKESYNEVTNNRRNGEGYDPEFDPFEAFDNDFGIVEDLLYNQDATDAVHKELLAKLGHVGTKGNLEREGEGTPSRTNYGKLAGDYGMDV